MNTVPHNSTLQTFDMIKCDVKAIYIRFHAKIAILFILGAFMTII